MGEREGGDDLDAELARRVVARDRMAVTLVELEQHPGLQLLASSATGGTAQRWATARVALAGLWQDEERDRQRAQQLIATSGLAAPPDRLPALRARFDALHAPAGWAARAEALDGLRTAAADAARELHTARRLATGLLERRAELRGRFEAYRAKAARLGRAEHPDLLALDQRIRETLWTRPCDLVAATCALRAYQRLVPHPGR